MNMRVSGIRDFIILFSISCMLISSQAWAADTGFDTAKYATLIQIIGLIIFSVIVFTVGRMITCWYFKINEVVKLLTEIRDSLASMQAKGLSPGVSQKTDKLN